MRLIAALALLALTAAAPNDNQLIITFSAGSSALTPLANSQLDLAARLYRDAHPHVMFASGHTDASGDEFGNVLLSARRSHAVQQALVARGVPASRLLMRAFGASEPVDGEARRVVVTWR